MSEPTKNVPAAMSRRDFIKLAGIGLGAMAFAPYAEGIKTTDYSNIFNNETLSQSTPTIDYKDLNSFYSHFNLNISKNSSYAQTLQNKLNINTTLLDGAEVSWLVETSENDTNVTSDKLWKSIDKLNVPKSEIALITLQDRRNYIIYSSENNNLCFFNPNDLITDEDKIISCSIIKGGCIEVFTEDKTLIAVFDGVDKFVVQEQIIEPTPTKRPLRPWNSYQNVKFDDSDYTVIYTNNLSLYKRKVNKSNSSVQQIKSGESQIFELNNNVSLRDEFKKPFLFSFNGGVGYLNLQTLPSDKQENRLHFSVLQNSQNSDITTNINLSKLYEGIATGTYHLNVSSDMGQILQTFKDNGINSLPIGIVSISHDNKPMPWIIIGLNRDGSIDLNEIQKAVQQVNETIYPELPEIWQHPFERTL